MLHLAQNKTLRVHSEVHVPVLTHCHEQEPRGRVLNSNGSTLIKNQLTANHYTTLLKQVSWVTNTRGRRENTERRAWLVGTRFGVTQEV